MYMMYIYIYVIYDTHTHIYMYIYIPICQCVPVSANHKPIMKMPKLSWMSKLITTGEQGFFAKNNVSLSMKHQRKWHKMMCHIICIYVRISIIIFYIYMSDKMSECPNMCQNVRIVVIFWWLNLHSWVTMGNCFQRVNQLCLGQILIASWLKRSNDG